MTEGNAIFLIGLMVIALGLSACTFIFKYMILSYASGLLWWIIGIERILNRANYIDVPLAILFFIFGIGMFLSQIIMREKPKPPEKPLPDRPADRLERNLKKHNEATGRFKTGRW